MLDAVSARTRGALVAAACGTVALLAAAPSAAADPVACGDTITTNVTLEADLTGCLGAGLIVGADDITIDLDGHQIQSGVFNVAPGIDNSAGHDGVRIKDGRITGFSTGVVLDGADDNVLRDIDAVSNAHGIGLSASDRNRIVGGEVKSNGYDIRLGSGIVIQNGSDDNRVVGVDVGSNQGDNLAIVTSTGNTVVDSTVTGSVSSAVNVYDSPGTRIANNTLTAGTIALSVLMEDSHDSQVVDNALVRGVYVRDSNDVRVARNTGWRASIRGGERVVVRDNTFDSYIGSGIVVSATAVDARVIGNVSNGHWDDGIDVAAPGTLIRGNTANGNGLLGIRAVAGVIDGGGNTATGNGDPLQCVNVACP
jgi:hypothetical protein